MTLNERIHNMLVQLKPSDDHPAWYAPRVAVAYISERLRVVDRFSGPIVIDEDTVAKLEAAMPKRKPKKVSATLTARELKILRLIVEVHRESEYESNGVGVETADAILAKLQTLPTAERPVKPLVWEVWWYLDEGHREHAVTPYGADYHVSDDGWWTALGPLHPCDGIEAAKAAVFAYHEKVVRECLT